MFILIIILFAVLVIILGINTNKKEKQNNEAFKNMGYDMSNKIESGKYLGGHPDINNEIARTLIFSNGDIIEIFNFIPFKIPTKIGAINKSAIKNIIAEDQSTIESRVTAGRLLTVGVFAFAWKKKKKVELAYLTIEWNDGRFDHETIFEFEGLKALQRANTTRNNLIKTIN